MGVTLSLAITGGGPTKGNGVMNGIATVTNTEAGTVELVSLTITEASQMGAVVSGPYFLTPNANVDVGPSLTTGSTAYYPFQVVCAVPNTPGASPNAPNALHGNTFPASNSWLRLQGAAVTNDGSSNFVGDATLNIPLSSAVAPFPVPQGGALQFNSGGDGIHYFFL